MDQDLNTQTDDEQTEKLIHASPIRNQCTNSNCHNKSLTINDKVMVGKPNSEYISKSVSVDSSIPANRCTDSTCYYKSPKYNEDETALNKKTDTAEKVPQAGKSRSSKTNSRNSTPSQKALSAIDEEDNPAFTNISQKRRSSDKKTKLQDTSLKNTSATQTITRDHCVQTKLSDTADKSMQTIVQTSQTVQTDSISIDDDCLCYTDNSDTSLSPLNVQENDDDDYKTTASQTSETAFMSISLDVTMLARNRPVTDVFSSETTQSSSEKALKRSGANCGAPAASSSEATMKLLGKTKHLQCVPNCSGAPAESSFEATKKPGAGRSTKPPLHSQSREPKTKADNCKATGLCKPCYEARMKKSLPHVQRQVENLERDTKSKGEQSNDLKQRIRQEKSLKRSP